MTNPVSIPFRLRTIDGTVLGTSYWGVQIVPDRIDAYLTASEREQIAEGLISIEASFNGPHSSTPVMLDWCNETLEKIPESLSANQRWYHDGQENTFWFRDEPDSVMFLLRWG